MKATTLDGCSDLTRQDADMTHFKVHASSLGTVR
jgi:hypothetical protein